MIGVHSHNKLIQDIFRLAKQFSQQALGLKSGIIPMPKVTHLPTPFKQIKELTKLLTLNRNFDVNNESPHQIALNNQKENSIKKPNRRNTELKDQLDNKNVSMAAVDGFIEQVFYQPLTTMFTSEQAKFITNCFKNYLDDYLSNFVPNTAVYFMTQDELEILSMRFYLPIALYNHFLTQLPKETIEQIRLMLISEKKSLTVIKNHYLAVLKEYEIKEDIKNACRKSKLTARSIYNFNPEKNEQWDRIKLDFLIAVALDTVRTYPKGQSFIQSLQEILLAASDERKLVVKSLNCDMQNFIATVEVKRFQDHSLFKEKYHKLNSLLSLEFSKDTVGQINSQNLIAEMRNLISENPSLTYASVKIDALEARWHVFSGNSKEAVKLYQKAFDNSLFSCGDTLPNLIKECLAATAYLQSFEKSKFNTSFLSHLKIACTNFGYDMAAVDIEPHLKKERENKSKNRILSAYTVADWEEQMWAKYFQWIFSSEICFPDVEYSSLPAEIPYFSYKNLNIPKPDYKNSNNKITLFNRKMPQLVGYSWLHGMPGELQDRYLKFVKKLLDNGASVNQLSGNNESALLIALEKMDLKDVTQWFLYQIECHKLMKKTQNILPESDLKEKELYYFNTQDRTLFDLLTAHDYQKKYTKKVVNQITSPLEKFPLMQAVRTGRPDVVQTILKMGAEVDKTNFEMRTPLYECLLMLKDLKKSDNNFNRAESFIRSEVFLYDKPILESIRRMNAYTQLDDILYSDIWENSLRIVSKSEQDKQAIAKFLTILENFKLEIFRKYTSVENLKEILRLLVNAGADVNHSHSQGSIKDFTPLMQAVIINDFELFNLLKEANGDLTKNFTIDDDEVKNSIQYLKKHFNSNRITL